MSSSAVIRDCCPFGTDGKPLHCAAPRRNGQHRTGCADSIHLNDRSVDITRLAHAVHDRGLGDGGQGGGDRDRLWTAIIDVELDGVGVGIGVGPVDGVSQGSQADVVGVGHNVRGNGVADRDQQRVAALAAFVVLKGDAHQVRAVHAVHVAQIESPLGIPCKRLLARAVAVVDGAGPDVRAQIVDRTGCGQHTGIVQHNIEARVDDGSHVADRDRGRRAVDCPSVVFHLDGNRVDSVVIDSGVIQLLPGESRCRTGRVGVVTVSVQVPGEGNQRAVQVERSRRIKRDRTTFVDCVRTRHPGKRRHITTQTTRHAYQERIGAHIAQNDVAGTRRIRSIHRSPVVVFGIDRRRRTVRDASHGVHRNMTVVHSDPRRRSGNSDSVGIIQDRRARNRRVGGVSELDPRAAVPGCDPLDGIAGTRSHVDSDPRLARTIPRHVQS